MTTKRTAPGRFSWHELSTRDVKDAISFYSELFGWKTSEMDMGGQKYTLIKQGDKDIAGITTPMQGDPSPPHWNLYASVHNADAAVKRAKELGGKALTPVIDIPNVGRFAAVEDPQGAVLFPFESANDEVEPEGKPAEHTFCWDELLTSDTKAAVAFYKGIYGYSITDTEMGPPFGTYHVLNRGDKMSGGIMKNISPIAPHWITYVAVAKLENTLKRVESLKGKVLSQPMDIPNMGRFAVLADRQGAAIAIFQGGA